MVDGVTLRNRSIPELNAEAGQVGSQDIPNGVAGKVRIIVPAEDIPGGPALREPPEVEAVQGKEGAALPGVIPRINPEVARVESFLACGSNEAELNNDLAAKREAE
jgi:hypothetical protein